MRIAVDLRFIRVDALRYRCADFIACTELPVEEGRLFQFFGNICWTSPNDYGMCRLARKRGLTLQLSQNRTKEQRDIAIQELCLSQLE